MARTLKNVLSAGDWLPVIWRLPGNSRRICLSFDDGPSPATTPALVDLLASYRAKATFFLTGERASAHPGLVQALVDSGHEVYGHGWEHIRLDRVDGVRLLSDIERVEALLRRFRPTPSPYLVRLPYSAGRFDPSVHRTIRQWNPSAQIAVCSHSLKDWDLAMNCRTLEDLDRSCRTAVDRFVRQRRLCGAIVLLHESAYDRPAPLTPYIAPVLVAKILESMAARGFAFVPIEPYKRPFWISRFVLV